VSMILQSSDEKAPREEPHQTPPVRQRKEPPPGEPPRRDLAPTLSPDEPMPGIVDPLPPDLTPSEPVIG